MTSYQSNRIIIVLIILLHIGISLFVYAVQFGDFNLFCGDSAYYFSLAENINEAAADRPSGFPFILRYLLIINKDPIFLFIINQILITFAHILFFLSIAESLLSKRKYIYSFLLSLLFFCNPVVYFINNMIYMPDPWALFLISLSIYLFFNNNVMCYFITTIIFGYLTIIKSVFAYISFIPTIIILYDISKNKLIRSIRTKTIIIVAIVFCFISIPLSYAYLFNKPRLGVASIENFSGRSGFAKILSNMKCDEIFKSIPRERQKYVGNINDICDEHEIKICDSDCQIWIEDSFMNKLIHRLMTGDKHRERVDENRILGEMYIKAVINNPSLIITSALQSIKYYLYKPKSRQVYYLYEPMVSGGCEQLVPNILGIDVNEYLNGWRMNRKKNEVYLGFMDDLSIYMNYIMNNIIIGLMVFVMPCIFIKSILRNENINLKDATVYIYTMGYVLAISIGGIYDTRYYIIFNYLSLLIIGKTITDKWSLFSKVSGVKCDPSE